MPDSYQPKEVLKENESWRVIYLCGLVVNAFTSTCLWLFFPVLSLKDELTKKNDQAVKNTIQKLYRFDGSEKTLQTIKNEIIKNLHVEEDLVEPEKVGIVEVFTSKKYRTASWNGIIVAIIQQLSGITALFLCSVPLFEAMKNAGNFDIDISLSLNILNLLNMFASFGGNIFSSRIGQKKTMVFGCLA